MKKLISIILATLLLCGLLGCDNKSGLKEVEYAVWTPLGTSKIYRDVSYEISQSDTLKVAMARNEYESGQIIITAKSDGISSYDLKINDLTSSNGDKFSSENIQVFMEHYINVIKKNNSNNAYPLGYTPDALVPLEYAKRAKENVVEPNKNQGLYITFNTSKDTKAGIYSGAFDLIVNGYAKKINVELTVWDFAIPDEVHTQSCFMLNRNDIMNGELNNTEEMYKKYYDTLLNYRIAAMSVPNADRGVDEFVQSVKNYYNADNFSTYGILHSSDGNDVDYASLKTTLKKLAKICDENTNYLDKGIYYIFDLIDEPHLSTEGANKTKHIVEQIDNTEAVVFSELEEEGFFNGKTPAFKESIKKTLYDIPNVVTTYYTEEINKGNPLTWCPTIDQFNSADNRELYAKEQEEKGSLWWYGCAAPNYPHPNYHIDDNLLGARILSWMQKDYNIDGNLYWATTTYNKIELNQHGEDNITRPIDPYKDPQRMSERWIANGDGYLLYPGAYYGADHPFSSMRLESIRDGLEEYEYLYLLEELYSKESEYFNLEIDAKGVLQSMYDRLYSGTVYNQNGNVFNEVRGELASEILLALNNTPKFYITSASKELDNYNVEFVVDSGYSVKVNDKEINGSSQGKGVKYATTIKLDKDINNLKVLITKGDEKHEFTKYISSKVEVVSKFESDTELDKFVSSSTTNLSISSEQALSGKSMQVIASSKDTLGYYPTFSLKTTALKEKVTNIDNLSFNVYNANATNITLKVYLENNSGEKIILNKTLKAKEWNYIEIGKLYSVDWSGLKTTTAIRFQLDNYDSDGALMPIQTLYLDDISLSLRGGK